jgi:hypothetical protein
VDSIYVLKHINFTPWPAYLDTYKVWNTVFITKLYLLHLQEYKVQTDIKFLRANPFTRAHSLGTFTCIVLHTSHRYKKIIFYWALKTDTLFMVSGATSLLPLYSCMALTGTLPLFNKEGQDLYHIKRSPYNRPPRA